MPASKQLKEATAVLATCLILGGYRDNKTQFRVMLTNTKLLNIKNQAKYLQMSLNRRTINQSIPT